MRITSCVKYIIMCHRGTHMVPCLDLNKERKTCFWPSSYYIIDERDRFQTMDKYNITVEVKNRAKSVNFSYSVDPFDIGKHFMQ